MCENAHADSLFNGKFKTKDWTFFPFFIIENHDVGFDDYKICAGNLLEFKSCV
jgi:hypothetical protein